MPASMMWALKVTRSTMAATRRGSPMTPPHSENGRLEATATDTLSVSPVSPGDLLVVGVEADSATPATGLVGGGVATWKQIGYEIQTGIGLTYYDVELGPASS